MDYKFEWNNTVSYYAVDSKMKATLSAVMAYFQEIAIMHSDEAGYSIEKLAQQNLGWVITNYHIVINKMPQCGQKLILKTWSSTIKHFQAERSYTVEDEYGNVIIKASSRWVLIDLKKRSFVPVNSDMEKAYKTGAAPAVENERYKMPKERQRFVSDFAVEVTRSQTDTNGHVNNTQYAAWASDMVPDDIYNNWDCVDFKIVFRKESVKGEKLVLKTYINDTAENEKEIVTDFVNADDSVICTASFVFRQ